MPVKPVFLFYLLFLFLLLTGITNTNAQNSVWNAGGSAKKNVAQKAAREKTKVKDFKEHLQKWGLDTNYNRGLLLGGKANSNGWSGCGYYIKRLNHTTTKIYQLSFSEIKQEKQVKEQGTSAAYPELGAATQFVFGKMNNLYTLQLGIGHEHLLLPAVVDGNLSVSFRYTYGFSLAMLKPYYLKLVYLDSANPYVRQEKYSSTNRDKFLNSGAILGASNWGKSLGEIDYVPGVYLDVCMVIEPAKSKTFVQAITLGINAAFYSRDLPIMVDQPAYPYQASLYAGLALGKRWKK